MGFVHDIIGSLNGIVWNALVPLLLGVGILFTIVTGFIQIRYFKHMWKLLFSSNTARDGITSFQAFATSLAARVGTGNLAGVAVAMTKGGPGALFWMWVTALVGMSTSFIESALGQYFKKNHGDGTYRGGPAYYIEQGLNQRWMSILFSIFLIISFGFAFNAFQANTIADATVKALGAEAWFGGGKTPYGILGAILVILVTPIIFGGLKSIAKTASIIVPFMALAYLIVAIIVLLVNAGAVIPAFKMIFSHAFGLEQAVWGAAGYGIMVAMQQGVRRGLFSNEAGMGSAPNAAASATTDHPAIQGFVQSVGVFIDTIIICSATGVIIMLSGLLEPKMSVEGITLTQDALAQTIGGFAAPFIAIIIFFFSFTSIIANYSYGETNIGYIVGKKNEKLSIMIFRLMVLALVFIGSISGLSFIVNFADLSMGIMAIINLIAIVLLMPVALKIYKDYQKKLSLGNITFKKSDIDYSNNKTDPTVWSD